MTARRRFLVFITKMCREILQGTLRVQSIGLRCVFSTEDSSHSYTTGYNIRYITIKNNLKTIFVSMIYKNKNIFYVMLFTLGSFAFYAGLLTSLIQRKSIKQLFTV